MKKQEEQKNNQKEGNGAETTGVFRMDPLNTSRRSGSSSARGKIPRVRRIAHYELIHLLSMFCCLMGSNTKSRW